MGIDRRKFIKSGAMIAVGSTALGRLITAADAYAQKAPLKVLKPSEATTLGYLAELLVTGAQKAGVVHFVDYHLSIEPDDCLLTAKYFQIKPPYIDFYRAGLSALENVSLSQFRKPFHQLPKEKAHPLIESLFSNTIEGWQGPPAPLLYLLVRSDAVDVVYGTPEGFEKLEIPYMAHIMPPEGWS